MDSESDPLDSLSLSPPTFFNRDRHVMFLQVIYQLLPYQYQTQEINRLTLAYFVISGLHLLRSLNSIEKEAVANWILSFQAHPKVRGEINDGQFYGFHGPRTSQFPMDDNGSSVHNGSHLASTYCALAILKITGYDFSNIDSESILTSMRNLQQSDGRYLCTVMISFQSYDGGFGLIPGSESHGGATYCAVAALRLMGFIEDDLLSKNKSSSILNVPLLPEWSLQRQAADGGFQGRPNKDSHTCYAFWIGAVLRILGGFKFIDDKSLRRFLLTCQSKQVAGAASGSIPLLLRIHGIQSFGRARPETHFVLSLESQISLMQEFDLIVLLIFFFAVSFPSLHVSIVSKYNRLCLSDTNIRSYIHR